jgi:Chalcone isomerase-like
VEACRNRLVRIDARARFLPKPVSLLFGAVIDGGDSVAPASRMIGIARLKGWIVGAAALFFAVPSALDGRDVAGVLLPEAVSVSGRELNLNGTGVGKEKMLFDVYVIGLYLETKTSDAGAAIKADEGKRIVLTMLRDVSRERFVQAVEKCMVRNSAPFIGTLRSRLDALEQALPALRKGEVVDFTYLPESGTTMRGQGQEMAIPGKDFADALFSAWLGPEPDSKTLQHNLLVGVDSHRLVN